jgi:ubiquinone/menaquinone biosynthesis C-methylase UbiE
MSVTSCTKESQMAVQPIHHMMPVSTHDEASRQDYVLALKTHISGKLTPGNKVEMTHRVLPTFRKTHGRAPASRQELRAAMERAPHHQVWGSLMRLGQELMWESVEDTVDRQLDALEAKAKQLDKGRGSITHAKGFKPPRYVEAVDVHTMPGGYCDDASSTDLRAGAIYDRGAFMYHHGKRGMDDNGRLIVSFVRTRYPDIKPRRILDMGCSVGHATTALVDFFPDAEVHAIDVGAPMIRYAHARAEAMGRPIHFKVANAEDTGYRDGFFDLVVSSNMMHETSLAAAPRIFAECRRILKPGGAICHMEVPVRYKDLDLYDQVMRGWQTYYNGEPFWNAVCALDLVEMVTAAGFRDAADGYLERTNDPDRDRRDLLQTANQGNNYRYMLTGRK